MPGSDGSSVPRRPWYSTMLLGSVVAMLFIVPAFPTGWHSALYNICLSAVLVCAALSMDRSTNRMVVFALGLTAIEWIAFFLDLTSLVALSRLLILLFFIWVVVRLIAQIARTRVVTGRVITEAINGYLLLGIVFSVFVMILTALDGGAITSGTETMFGRAALNLNEAIYFGFITFTTLGYGDIVPKSPIARSLAIAASVSGQIYLTVIIAMLVGKFLTRPRGEA